MQKENIYTLKNGLIPVPNKWVIPGLRAKKGNLDAFKFIINLACKRYEKEEKAVMAKTRRRELLQVRQIIHCLLKENFPKVTLCEIGRRCGGKDHATVLHSSKAVNNLVDTNKKFREEYSELDKIVKDNIFFFRQTYLKGGLKAGKRG